MQRVAIVTAGVQLGAALVLLVFIYVVAAKMEQYGRLTKVARRQYVKSVR